MGNQLKNIRKKSTTKSNGITLIALVITIVVLLILASVSIAMLTGSNGILTQAKLAKENTEAAKEKEEKDLDKINSYINEKTIKDNYTDINGEKATIPEGFIVDETENIVSKGLVVHGLDKVNGDNGSEFVWVPVPDINSMSQCSTAGGDCNLQLEDGVLKCKTHNDNEEIVGKLYSESIEQNGISDTSNKIYNENEGLREPAFLGNESYADKSNYNTIGLELEEMKTNYKNMATSVAQYGGFYVGRYETSLSDANESFAGTTGTVQSKQGVIPTASENNATKLWYGLYSKQNKTYTGNNNSVESSMIWGSQYERILNWAKEQNKQEKITSTSLGNNAGGIVKTTGNLEYSNDDINNIKDLGGNLREWTLEAHNMDYRVCYGGSCNFNGSPSSRYDGYPNGIYTGVGSRMTLYIK